ncbi:uncharacterized protein E0L32_012043 [Thyridium curvatum]|uniref:F-box domain-containing protein n=1 Tax=Thyridium curvatum TaxID=1093900 RepID=A0A507BFW5_9PEZI|nr:uncharacterized protein E0L32_012043 [Thyridium curvatum]TPX17664.1 hypothetical protein E0L32_012043 [Thyridium curvatum]
MKFFKKRDKKKAASESDFASYPHRPRGFSSGSPPHGQSQSQSQFLAPGSPPRFPTRRSAQALAALPPNVLARIFAFVCPHSQDETYETCELSGLGNACMLCDIRDLAHCALTCRRWRKEAVKQLYHSVRIETVHYCDREIYLSDKRKRRTFFDRNGEPEDVAQARLKLLCRTLREDPARLGPIVEFLKTPYMLRESCQADLARTIAVLPNLRYVDLPEGLFMDEPPFLTLRLEVQARCHNLRKMTFMGGAERSLEDLAGGRIWPNLEVLELVKVNMEPLHLRHVLGALRNLRALKVTDTNAFGDQIFMYNDMVPDFPPLEELVLKSVPHITAEGFREYLRRADARMSLKLLSLTATGVKPWHLQAILGLAPALRHLTIVETVTAALPIAAGTQKIVPLASGSLRTLNYEISADSSSNPYAGITSSYYTYLSGSLHSGGLPRLRSVYVRDPDFQNLLLGLPPPMPGFADGGSRRPASSGSSSSYTSGRSPISLGPVVSANGLLSPHHSPGFAPPQHYGQPPFGSSQSPPKSGFASLQQQHLSQQQQNPRFSSNNPFASMIAPKQVQTLEVYVKGDDDLDWSMVMVSPDGPLLGGGPGGGGGGGDDSGGRPTSSYGLGADVAVGAGARRSVFMGDGSGSFLAVPDLPVGGGGPRRGSGAAAVDEWPRPKSSAGERKRERMDLWR